MTKKSKPKQPPEQGMRRLTQPSDIHHSAYEIIEKVCAAERRTMNAQMALILEEWAYSKEAQELAER